MHLGVPFKERIRGKVGMCTKDKVRERELVPEPVRSA